jgi:hypothetical protein
MRRCLWSRWAVALAIPLYVVLFEHLSGKTVGMGMTSLYLVTLTACSVPLFYLDRNGGPRLVKMLFVTTTVVFLECLALGVVSWMRSGLAGTQ